MVEEMKIVTPSSGVAGLLDRVLGGEKLGEKDLSRISFEERLWLIQRVPLGRKAHMIISSPDPMKLLKKLSPQEIYLTVKESWGDDAAIILEMTPPQKIPQLMDIDIWKRDRIDFNRFMEWLQLISEGGERALTKNLFALDPPLLVLLFKSIIEVTSRNVDQDQLELTDNGWYSFDYIYYFKPKLADLDFDSIVMLLSRFFEMEPEYYKIIMEGVIGELPSPMEEEAFRLRSSRMSKIGFPDFYEAQELLLYEDPKNASREIIGDIKKVIYLDDLQEDELPPRYWLLPQRSGEEDGMFEELMGGISDIDEEKNLLWELSYLIHKLVAAEGCDLTDTGELMSSVGTARDYINLGLEFVTGGSSEEGKRIIREAYLQRVFRLGHSLVLDLKRMGVAAFEELRGTLDPSLWGNTAQSLILGLSAKRPFFYEGLDSDGDGYRNFSSTKDIYYVEKFLEELKFSIRLISELVTIPTDTKPYLVKNAYLNNWGLESIFLTAMARRCLNDLWVVIPLGPEDLLALYNMLKDNRKKVDDAVTEAEEKIEKISEEYGESERFRSFAKSFIRNASENLAQELLAIRSPADIDPRFIVSVITAYSMDEET